MNKMRTALIKDELYVNVTDLLMLLMKDMGVHTDAREGLTRDYILNLINRIENIREEVFQDEG